MSMTDNFGDIQVWECWHDDRIFNIKTGERQTHNHITGKPLSSKEIDILDGKDITQFLRKKGFDLIDGDNKNFLFRNDNIDLKIEVVIHNDDL